MTLSLIMMLLLSVQAGCSSANRAVYENSHVLPPLEVPPDLDRPEGGAAMVVPDHPGSDERRLTDEQPNSLEAPPRDEGE